MRRFLMTLLTAGEQVKINKTTPSFKHFAVAERLTAAQTLQAPGRPATGHVRVATNPNDTDTLTITAVETLPNGATRSSSKIYEIEVTGGVTAGHVAVTKGGTAALTATALAAAILATQGHLLAAVAHATDTTVVDLRLRTPGARLTLATSSGGRLVVQDNAEELLPGELQLYAVRRTVTAEDDTRDRVRIDTGLATIVSYTLRISTSATNNTELAWDGATTVTGGVIELDNTGSTDLAANNIIALVAVGTR
jgi:hypothetical protein